MFLPTAALIVEIVSPGDMTWEKLPFYARHQVDELLIVDKQERRLHWLALTGAEYKSIASSRLIQFGPGALAARIDSP